MTKIPEPTVEWEALQLLCKRLSPSIIPELRGRAKQKRAEQDDDWILRAAKGQGQPFDPNHRLSSQYPEDFICDFVEAVYDIVRRTVPEEAKNPEVYVPWWMSVNWATYDQLRYYGRPDE